MKAGIRYGVALALWANVSAGPVVAQTPLGEVSFTLYRQSIILPVILNQKDTLRLLLDTGWGPLALVSSTAERLGLSVESPVGAGDLPRTRQASLGVGQAVKQNPTFEIFPTQELGPLIGPYDGILSTAFFRDLVLQIDYPRRVVRFYARSPIAAAAPPDAPGRASVPLVFSPQAGMLPFTDSVFVDGQSVRTLFDTGGAGAFLAMGRMVQRFGLKPVTDSTRGGIGMLSEGRATQAPLRFTRVGRIVLGGIAVDSPRVIMAPAQLEGGNWGHDLIIGTGLLQNYVVTFDYPNRRITFQPGVPSGR